MLLTGTEGLDLLGCQSMCRHIDMIKSTLHILWEIPVNLYLEVEILGFVGAEIGKAVAFQALIP